MQTTQSVSDLLKGTNQLDFIAFEEFFHKIQVLRDSRLQSEFSRTEAALLQKLAEQPSAGVLIRWHFLIGKRDADSLSEKEFDELVALTATMEKRDLKRLQTLARLADLRKMSLPEVVDFYKIRPAGESVNTRHSDYFC